MLEMTAECRHAVMAEGVLCSVPAASVKTSGRASGGMGLQLQLLRTKTRAGAASLQHHLQNGWKGWKCGAAQSWCPLAEPVRDFWAFQRQLVHQELS